MSDKDRKKKDGGRKDKKTQAMRERENERVQQSNPRQQGRDASNLTESEAGAATSNRRDESQT